MSQTPRKNGWSVAEQAGDHTPDEMQRLLGPRRVGRTRSDGHRSRLRGPGTWGGPDAVAVLDETGQAKKGEHTAGVKRQYVGWPGQVANAINIRIVATCSVPAIPWSWIEQIHVGGPILADLTLFSWLPPSPRRASRQAHQPRTAPG
jgi:hypothetical protein